MNIITLLLSLVYLAVVFVFVGAMTGFIVGLMVVLIFGVDLASLPLFAAGGAVAFSLWAFRRVFSNDAGTATVVMATSSEHNWMPAVSVETFPSLVDRPLALVDAVAFDPDVDASACAGQPRCMIDAFTLGDNLYETVYGP